MHRSLQVIALSLSLAACGTLSAQDVDAPEQPLNWLSGCWQHVNGTTQETWTQSYNGLLFGHSLTRRDTRVVAFEDIRIEPRNNQSAYIVSVNGAEGVVFTETDQGEMEITFENPDHDFPQRIAYKRSGSDMTATISLLDDKNAISFDMKACEAYSSQ